MRVLKKGDTFEAEVVDLTSAGQGVVKHSSGLTCFSSGVWLGEHALFQVVDIKKNYAQLKVVELLKSSESRREPPCSYAQGDTQSCGGCPWMFVNYEAQLEAKQRRVEFELKRRLPKFEHALKQIIPSEQELHYRNRVQFKSDGTKLGFLASQSHTLIDIEECQVVDETLVPVLRSLRAMLPNDDWRPKSRHSRSKHRWVTLDVDYKYDERKDAVEEQVSLNKRLPFKQANDLQNIQMKLWLQRKINALVSEIKNPHNKPAKIVELFCGAGNFTEVLQSFNGVQVLASECGQGALKELDSYGWENVETHEVDLFCDDAFRKFIKKCKAMDILVLDPPRDGLKVSSGLFDKGHQPADILYVSCDVATFFRDATKLYENGYRLLELQPLDLFPQTPHIELMAHFSL